ncbi:hypothetical protein MKW92_018464 [Papaver armeniacum]|nr:hypothetical protein MKW92_018464 [Papaver armeniacum]
MYPPLTLHGHPMCVENVIILACFCADNRRIPKMSHRTSICEFFGECIDLKIKLDRCFRQEKAVKRKANFEESKKLKERLQAYRKETA